MHELEELIDDRLEEFPVSSEESGVLSHHVHDVGSDDGLVVFAPLLFAQTQEVLDDGHQEPFLVLLVHGPANGANGPAQLQHTHTQD